MSPSRNPAPLVTVEPLKDHAGERVTVTIEMPDGTRYISVGDFGSATIDQDWIEQPRASWDDQRVDYERGEQVFTLVLRRANTVGVSPKVAQGQRRIGS